MSMKEFFTWKEAEETKNYIYYSKHTSTKKGKSASYLYYHCQKDGHSKPHRCKGEEQRKTAKRNKKVFIKKDMLCPSRIICKIDLSGAINVTYIQSHNHPIQFKDTEHQPMSKSVLANVRSKLIMGASVDNIHKDLRGGKDSRDNRADANNLQCTHAVSKRQLREIARKLKVNRRMHPDDAASLYYIVKKLQDEKFDPVLLYKPQGEDFVVKPPNMSSDEIDELPITNDTFILGIQTKQQLNMFQKNALKIVCPDSTHSTNKYEFKLITLVVPDEYSKGYPVAHLISNREDELILYYFFEEIKRAL